MAATNASRLDYRVALRSTSVHNTSVVIYTRLSEKLVVVYGVSCLMLNICCEIPLAVNQVEESTVDDFVPGVCKVQVTFEDGCQHTVLPSD